jgi:hypothetical protein
MPENLKIERVSRLRLLITGYHAYSILRSAIPARLSRDSSMSTRKLARLILLAGLTGLMIAWYANLLLHGGSKMNLNWGVDFGDYWLAGGRVLRGQSPYAPAMLAGPFSAGGLDRFRYPPPFALVVSPLALLPLEVAKSVWAAMSLVALYIGCWLAARAGGARTSGIWEFAERVMVTTLVFGLFLPVFDSVSKGNVEGIEVLALGAALGAGTLVAVGSVLLLGILKIAPVLVWPAALWHFKAGFWRAAGLVAALLVLSLPLLVRGWLDFPTVLINQLAGSGDFLSNMAPTQTVHSLLPGNPGLESIVRAGTLLISAGLVAASLRYARRRDGWPAALFAALVASLLVPGVIWGHYLVLLLPFVFFTWPPAERSERVLLAGSLGLAALSMVFVSVGMLLATPLIVVILRLLVRRSRSNRAIDAA